MFKIFLFKPNNIHYQKLEKISEGKKHSFAEKLDFLDTKDFVLFSLEIKFDSDI
jgi:hypothetical protein